MFTRHWIESLARFVIAEVLLVAPAFILMYVPGKLAPTGCANDLVRKIRCATWPQRL